MVSWNSYVWAVFVHRYIGFPMIGGHVCPQSVHRKFIECYKIMVCLNSYFGAVFVHRYIGFPMIGGHVCP